ncbi:hypothetical protein CRYUN_Cryun03dG0022900 [Craigia yunnanensis]
MIKYVASKPQDKITAISCSVGNCEDCSMLLLDDGGQAVKKLECPNCWRLFCAQCKAPWHTGIECGEFQRLHKDEREREDIMKLAKDKMWSRCPSCRFVVERTQGCSL